jgi:hypothetical protein
MLNTENCTTFGWDGAIRGMRNPMNSWHRSDSHNCVTYGEDCWGCDYDTTECDCYYIGEKDLGLMKRLAKAGSEHAKYLRMVHIQMDIVAPLYWWKEFDTYKIGTVANSCSTMHKIHDKEFTMDDFSHEHLKEENLEWLDSTIDRLNRYRKMYNLAKEKYDWWQLIQMLPSSYNQRRTVDMNYQTALNIIKQRKNHRLDEWHTLCDALLELPYMKELSGSDE